MRKVTILTGKNLPRLAVAKPGWPAQLLEKALDKILEDAPEHYLPNQPYLTSADPKTGKITISPVAIEDFTRVCDQTGLSEKLRKD